MLIPVLVLMVGLVGIYAFMNFAWSFFILTFAAKNTRRKEIVKSERKAAFVFLLCLGIIYSLTKFYS